MRNSALRDIPDLKSACFCAPDLASREATRPVAVALLTGGTDRHYTYGLAMSLVTSGVYVDVVGGSEVDGPEMHSTPGLNFLDVWKGPNSNEGLLKKGVRLLTNYARLIAYAWGAKPKIFHILWNNRIEWFDRTLLMSYYRILGKKIVMTAHNVNMGRRDNTDSVSNRLTLKIQYSLAHRIFVHTEKMKGELVRDFGVCEKAVTVIPYGINNALPTVDLTSTEARHRLGISNGEKTILFFGNMRPSKGLDDLLAALELLHAKHLHYKLIVAGRPIKRHNDSWQWTRRALLRLQEQGKVVLRNEFIPDRDVPLYFTAADVLALPYREIFQSGVLFLGYSFGLPVVATDVGELKKDIVEGRTGFICRPRDPESLAAAIETYFQSDLFRELKNRRQEIRDYANARHSWSEVARITRAVYRELTTETLPEISKVVQ
ncbi:MAG TPA: glycosyltransferase family 4 protein [Terriglobia bacterium]|nr:glycosyltransferase family 4 protein [Terriglobia bacterium]